MEDHHYGGEIDGGMNYKEVLDHCFSKLVEDLDPDILVDALIETLSFDSTKLRDIQEQRTTSAKNRAIVGLISSAEHYRQFLDCLRKSHQEYLADHLVEKEKELEQTRPRTFTNKKKMSALQNVPDRPVTDQDLSIMSAAIGVGWKDLAYRLGISHVKLQHIQSDNRLTKEQIVAMLQTWKQSKHKNATLKCLLQACIDTETTLDHDLIQRNIGFRIDGRLTAGTGRLTTVDQSSDICDGLETTSLSSNAKSLPNPTLRTGAHMPMQPNRVVPLQSSSSSQVEGAQTGTIQCQSSSSSHVEGAQTGTIQLQSSSSSQVEGPQTGTIQRQSSSLSQVEGPQTETIQCQSSSSSHVEGAQTGTIQLQSSSSSQVEGPQTGTIQRQSSSSSQVEGAQTGTIQRQSSSSSQVEGPQTGTIQCQSSSSSSLAQFQTSRTILVDIPVCVYNGQLSTLTNEQITELKNRCTETNTTGGFGTVYISKEIMPEFKMKMALKEIRLETANQTKKIRSIQNEKMASRILHFGIVPLLAIGEDTVESIPRTAQEGCKPMYHFLSPYLEKGDLFHAIERDREAQVRGQEVELDSKGRLRILYHIAAAIEYLHTDTSPFRRPIIHMDIKSANIVLDGQYNARLIDFGLAREVAESCSAVPITQSEIMGTEGYFPTASYLTLTKQHDYYNFGVVIREVLTGIHPAIHPAESTDERQQLRKLSGRKIHSLIAAKIWQTSEAETNMLVKLSTECIDSIRKENTTTIKLKEEIISAASFKRWEAVDDKRCEICMINPKDEESNAMSGHDTYCNRKIQVCVACMRNSFLNPIMCHTCDRKILPPVGGEEWGAILVAGNDKNAKDGVIFKDSVMELKNLFTSKTIPLMCLREENVQVIHPREPGATSADKMSDDIKQAFDKLKAKKKINTLVFVYCGHHRIKRFDLNGDDTDNMADEQLCDLMKQLKVSKFIVILDCCHGDTLEDLKPSSNETCLIQINATSSHETTDVGSGPYTTFSTYLIQAFRMKALGTQCDQHTTTHCSITCDTHVSSCDCYIPFITISKLLKYLKEHLDNDIRVSMLPAKYEDQILAYNISFKVYSQFKVRVDDKEATEKQKDVKIQPSKYTTMPELKKLLFKEYLDLNQEHHFQGTDTKRLLEDYADILSIVLRTGPKHGQQEEIDCIEKLVSAFNGKRMLRVEPRQAIHIKHGKVALWCAEADFVYKTLKENETKFKINETDENVLSVEGADLEKCRDKLEEEEKRLPQNESPKKKTFTMFVNVIDTIATDMKEETQEKKLRIIFPVGVEDKVICFEIVWLVPAPTLVS